MSLDDPLAAAPKKWITLTSPQQTIVRVRPEEISSYGDAPTEYQGNAWITYKSTDGRWYVLETLQQLDAILQ